MIVDTSALVAILTAEEDGEAMLDLLASCSAKISAAMLPGGRDRARQPDQPAAAAPSR